MRDLLMHSPIRTEHFLPDDKIGRKPGHYPPASYFDLGSPGCCFPRLSGRALGISRDRWRTPLAYRPSCLLYFAILGSSRIRSAQILLDHIGLIGQRLVQLDARVDPEFGEDVTQVVFDGSRADEQSRADLSVRQGFAG